MVAIFIDCFIRTRGQNLFCDDCSSVQKSQGTSSSFKKI